MNREKVLHVIRDVLGVEHEGLSLTDDMHLYDDLAADSLDLAELDIEIDSVLGVVIPSDVVATWQTVGDVLRSVEQAEAAA